MKKLLLIVTVALVGLALLAGGVQAKGAPPDGDKGNGEKPEPREGVVYFVDFVGPPGITPNNANFTDQSPLFKVFRSGSTLSIPASYRVDDTGAPAGTLAAVNAAFATWDGATSATLFTAPGATTTAPSLSGSLCNRPTPVSDGLNDVLWASLTGTPFAGAIGVTCSRFVGFPTFTTVAEFDMVLNTDFSWTIGGSSTTFDVQNEVTHEAGHTLWLDDLTQPSASELTMFGFGAFGETKARTLGLGDTLGVQFLYGS